MANVKICTFCPEGKEYFLNDLFSGFFYFEPVIYVCIQAGPVIIINTFICFSVTFY